MVLDFLKRPAETATKVDGAQSQQRPEAGTQLEIPTIDVQTSLNPEARPVLDDAEERFLSDAASETDSQLETRGSVTITDDGKVIEHESGTENTSGTPGEAEAGKGNAKKRRFSYWSFVPQATSNRILSNVPKMPTVTDISSWRPSSRGKDRETTADDLMSAANEVKASSASGAIAPGPPETGAAIDEEEVTKEKRDISAMLSNLHLSSINNRVFSLSKDSQNLLERFKLILRDIVNGAPTAYHDLESLLTEQNAQIDKLYNKMPPSIQTLVKSLPTKMMSAYAPALMAASAGASADTATAADAKKKKKSAKPLAFIPSLKSLVYEKGAIMTIFQSILQFLRLRFPAILAGTNVLMSLALFILLFILWYCHKRGKEVRLAHESEAASASASASTDPAKPPTDTNTDTDTDPDPDPDPAAIPVEPLPTTTAAAAAAADAASLGALEAHTSLAASQRHAAAIAAAARATLPDAVPLPRADTMERGALGGG